LGENEINIEVTNNKVKSQESNFETKELEISNKIEDYILKLLGREVIIMDKIVFFLNKIMLLLLIPIFLQRCDLPTVSCS
jgi:hypothetical protein